MNPLLRFVIISMIALSSGVVAGVLPQPTGPYAVGHKIWHHTDTSRFEVHSVDPADFRELVIHVWYPAVDSGAAYSPYLSTEDASGITLALFGVSRPDGFPATSWRVDNAALRPQSAAYPVLVFNPGFAWDVMLHQSLLAEAASRGYIVVAINHPFDGASMLLSNGTRVSFTQRTDVPLTSEEETALIAALGAAQNPAAGLTDAQKEDLWETVDVLHPIVIEGLFQTIWPADISATLDFMGSLNAGAVDPQFTDMLNLDNIGFYGMSGGGAATVNFCKQDSRCKAGINMDGTSFGMANNGEVVVPFMFMMADGALIENDINSILFRRFPGRVYRAQFDGAIHASFADWPYTIICSPVCVTGPAQTALINNMSLAFFDKHLLGQPGTLLDSDLTTLLPDIVVDIRNNDVDGDGVADEQDNCTFSPNADQADDGGLNSTDPDGIGNACQCADVSGDNQVSLQDFVFIRIHLLGLEQLFGLVVDKTRCDINGDGRCSNSDAIIIRRALQSLPPGIKQTCMAAAPE